MGPLGVAILVLFAIVFTGWNTMTVGTTTSALIPMAPSENAPARVLVSFLNAHVTEEWLQVYLGGMALALVVVYVSRLRVVLRNGRKTDVLPNTAFGGGLVFVAAATVAESMKIVYLLAAHHHQAISVAKSVYFVSENSELLFLFGTALLTAATGLAILTGSVLPRWLGYVSLVVAIITVAGPVISFFGFIATAVWFPLLGLMVESRTSRNGNV